MKNLVTLVIVIIVLYTIFQDKNREYKELADRQKLIEQKTKEGENIEDVAVKSNEELSKSDTEEKNYQYEPKNMFERVVTNVVSDFIKTPEGSRLAKNFVLPAEVKFNSVSNIYPTHSQGAAKRRYNPQILAQGYGNRTICGQKIKLDYLITTKDNQEIDKGVVEYKIGSNKVKELNIIPSGMALAEIIRAGFHSENSKEQSNVHAAYIILTLSEILDNYDFDINKVKIFDEYITDGNTVECGDSVNLHYTAKSVYGETLKQGIIAYTVGDFSYPHVLSYAVEGMPYIGTRTVIVPGKYLSTAENKIMNLEDSNEVILIELQSPSKDHSEKNILENDIKQ